MSNCLLTLRSPTHALKAQAVLKNNGINVQPIKLGSEYSSVGCSHGIRFDCNKKSTVIRLLSENKIPFSQVRK